MDPYRDHLRARHAVDRTVPVTHLLHEIRPLGYSDSANLLVRYPTRAALKATDPPPLCAMPAASCPPVPRICFRRNRPYCSALPGAVQDVCSARGPGIVDALAEAGITCGADKGHQGAGGTVRDPLLWPAGDLSTGREAANRYRAKIRAPRRAGCRHPQVVAISLEAPVLDHSHNRPWSICPLPAYRQLGLRTENAHCERLALNDFPVRT